MGTFIFTFLFVVGANANLVCAELFDNNNSLLQAPRVIKWVEQVESSLKQVNAEPGQLPHLLNAKVDIEKVAFFKMQEVHLQELLLKGEVSFLELGMAKPISVRDVDSNKNYILMQFQKDFYVFTVDGREAPIPLTSQNSIGFLTKRSIERLESEQHEYLIRNGEVQYIQKRDITTSELPLQKALDRDFQEIISKLQHDGKINSFSIEGIEMARTNYSRESFLLIPTASLKDYYLISLVDKSVILAKDLNTSIHGTTLSISNGLAIVIKTGPGYKNQASVTASLNSVMPTIDAIQAKAEIILKRPLTKVEVQTVNNTFNLALQKQLDMSNPKNIKIIQNEFIKIENLELGEIIIDSLQSIGEATSSL